jgi:hypothetical protein
VPNDPPYVTRYAGSYKCENLAEPVYVQRSVRFQYSQTFLDPFVAPNKIITHFLLIAVVPEILADIVRRVADDNIGGVGFDPSHTNDTVFVVYFIDLYILLYRLRRRRRRCRNRRGGRWTKSLY